MHKDYPTRKRENPEKLFGEKITLFATPAAINGCANMAGPGIYSVLNYPYGLDAAYYDLFGVADMALKEFV